MAVFDFPLEELVNYRGRNPRPDDFDAYWDRALAQMRAVEAAPQRKPAGFANPVADCYEYTFTGVDGARIYSKLLIPKGAKADRSLPAQIVFHGYSGASSADWSEYFAFVAAGFVVVAMDCRGQAGLSQDKGPATLSTYHGFIIRGLREGPEKLAYRSVFLDCAQLAGLVIDMPEVDPARVCASGGSQGGGLTLACAALEPRISKLTPCFPFLSDYYRVWEMDMDERAYDELRMFFRQQDPNHEQADKIFTTLGYIDVHHLAPRIKGKTLMAISLMDNVCPPSTQFAAYNNIAAPKDRVLYYDYGHEALPGWKDRQLRFLCEI